MKGKVVVEDYKIHCIIGVYPHERIKDQEISLNLELEFDISKCVKSDSLHDTIDYEIAAKICYDLAKEKSYRLLETFAHDALEILFQKLPLISATIKVSKKSALPLAKRVFFELSRGIDE